MLYGISPTATLHFLDVHVDIGSHMDSLKIMLANGIFQIIYNQSIVIIFFFLKLLFEDGLF